MKTNYLLKSRSKPSGARKFLIPVGVFAIVILLSIVFKGSIMRAMRPIWKSDDVITGIFKGPIRYFESKSSLLKENEELKAKIADYESLIISARSIEKRNEELLALLGREQETGGKAAGIIAHPPETPYDILIVDAGRSQGIDVGMKVESAEGYALGDVSESYATTARVNLYSLSGRKTDAVLERGMIPIILEGAGGGNFHVALPRDMVVVEGDRILMAGISGKLIAVVGGISLKPTDSFKEVIARLPVNVSSINEVIIR